MDNDAYMRLACITQLVEDEEVLLRYDQKLYAIILIYLQWSQTSVTADRRTATAIR